MTKKEQLEQLIKRNKVLHDIVIVGFKTSEELDAHRKTVEAERNEYYGNLPIIKKLKWELMSSEEQSEKKETIRKLLTKTRTKLSQAEILEIINKTIEKDGGL